jgi:hypothetical protein
VPANIPAEDDAGQRLARIQRLWDELKTTRRDPVKQEALSEQLRQESSAFLQKFDSQEQKH